MRVNYTLILLMVMFTSCVELPNLLPNGNGEDSDMVIVEYSNQLVDLIDNDTLIVDDMLSIRFWYNSTGLSCDGSFEMHMINGHILKANSGGSEFKFLSEGELVGGIIEGTWGNNIPIYSRQDFFVGCLTTYIALPEDTDAIIGIRFKDNDNKWHYGWVVLYRDTTSGEKIYIKAVGYNKQPGTNVRIGG